jgi:hypothetical protein
MTQPHALDVLLESLPALIARTQIEELLGGTISRTYLQNLDSEGRGPDKIRIGRKIAYTRESLVAWLKSRSS